MTLFYVLSYAPINRWYREREMHGSLRHRSNTMKIIRLSAMAALGFALLTGNALAQTLTPSPPSTGVSPGLPPLQSQIQSPLPPTGTTIIQPIPLTPPQLPPSVGILNLLERLRYAGHELPEFLRFGHFSRREPCNGAGDWLLQSQLRYSTACLQAILRSRAVVPAVNRNNLFASS